MAGRKPPSKPGRTAATIKVDDDRAGGGAGDDTPAPNSTLSSSFGGSSDSGYSGSSYGSSEPSTPVTSLFDNPDSAGSLQPRPVSGSSCCH